MNLEQFVDERYPEESILRADGFDEAALGIAEIPGTGRLVVVYDAGKCREILRGDMSEEEAEEYFNFNVAGAYVGRGTPLFMEPLDR